MNEELQVEKNHFIKHNRVCVYTALFLVEKQSLDVLGAYKKDPSFTYLFFTNNNDVKTEAEKLGWTCVIFPEEFKIGTLCSKHIKWNPWKYINTQLYDILIWIDAFCNLNPLYFDFIKTMTPEFLLRKHRSSKNVFDEINLCFLNKKINENNKKWLEYYAKTHNFHEAQYWTEAVIHPSFCSVQHRAFCKEMCNLFKSVVFRDQVCMPFAQKTVDYTKVGYLPLNFSVSTGIRKNHEYNYLEPPVNSGSNQMAILELFYFLFIYLYIESPTIIYEKLFKSKRFYIN